MVLFNTLAAIDAYDVSIQPFNYFTSYNYFYDYIN